MKDIIIFIDLYNDFDQILPFIDYVLSRQKAKIILYKTRKSNLSGCEDHLNYLKDNYNLSPVYYDRNFSKHYFIIFNIYKRFVRFSNKGKCNPFFLPLMIIASRLRPIASFLTEIEVKKNKSDLSADAILMDFGEELGFYGSSIVKFFQGADTVLVGYTHGYSMYTNFDPLRKDKSIPNLNVFKLFLLNLSKPRVKKRPYFDRYIAGKEQRNTYFSTSMMSNYESKYLNRVDEIGLIRFTKEWIDIYRNKVITPKNFSYGNEKKLNVVLFISDQDFNVHLDELMMSIKKLSQCKSINFVYKPHTRSLMCGMDNEKINGYDASNISSLELSSWADVGIVYGTSIAFQLILDRVPIIMPRYVHGNTTILEENNACIVVDDVASLIDIFEYSIDEINRMVDPDKVDYLIKHYVYGDGDYSSLMECFYKSAVDSY